jgi:hypothetical protein
MKSKAMEVPAIAAIIAKMEEKMRNMVVFSFVLVGQNLYYVLWQKQQIKKYDDYLAMETINVVRS